MEFPEINFVFDHLVDNQVMEKAIFTIFPTPL